MVTLTALALRWSQHYFVKDLSIRFRLDTPWYLACKKGRGFVIEDKQIPVRDIFQYVKMFSWTVFLNERWNKDTELTQKKRLIGTFLWPKFEHHCCLQDGILWLYVLDCEMPSFGQACSIMIPMNINPQWKIALIMIPRSKCSRERILIAMALRRKIKHVVVTIIVTANLRQSSCNSLSN